MPKLNKVAVTPNYKSSFPADSGFTLAGTSTTLFDWIGSFWSQVYKDPEFIKELQTTRALRISQLYLDLLENLKLTDRANAPVFHRERWYPIILRKSTRNTSKDTLIKISDDGTVILGKQDDNIYRPNTVLDIGDKVSHYSNMVLYPLDTSKSGIKSVMTCIVNNITRADVTLSQGVDFIILDGAIAISEEHDPFYGKHADKFPKFEILGDLHNTKDDTEVVLWGCDTLFDKDFIYKAFGYAFKLPSRTSELYKNIVNSAWNTVASGATPLLLQSLIATICGVPTVKEEGEVVEHISYFSDGLIQVITDKNLYSFPDGTELRKDIKRGAVLHQFDTLDKTIRVYACPTDVHKIANYNAFLDDFDEFTEDVPAIDLPPAFFKSDVKLGFSVDWDLRDVIYQGEDANGNPKLKFDIGGDIQDETTFWNDTWRSYEESNISMETCLEGIQYDKIYTVGAVWCQISPMEFFMHNLIGANTLIITIRTDTLAEDAPLYDPKFFGVVRECIPSTIRLYVIEHSAVPLTKYNTDTSVSDLTDLYVYDEYDEHVTYKKHKKGSSIKEHINSKWVASCKDDYDDNDSDDDYAGYSDHSGHNSHNNRNNRGAHSNYDK